MSNVIIKEAKSGRLLDVYYSERWRIMRKPFGLGKYSEAFKKKDKGIHLVGFLKKVPMGICKAHLNSSEEGELYHIGIDENYRRKGYGTRLLRLVHKMLKVGGVKYVVVNARDSVVPFYVANGYEFFKKGKTSVTGPHTVLKCGL